MCLAEVGAWGSATRTRAPPRLRQHQPYSRGPLARLEGVVQLAMRSCFRQGLCRERIALSGEAYHSPTFSFSGPLLMGIQRADRYGEQKFLVPQEGSAHHT